MICDDSFLQELLEHAQHLQNKPKTNPSAAAWDRIMLKQLIAKARARVRVLRRRWTAPHSPAQSNRLTNQDCDPG